MTPSQLRLDKRGSLVLDIIAFQCPAGRLSLGGYSPRSSAVPNVS
jgi:hypothetical protein